MNTIPRKVFAIVALAWMLGAAAIAYPNTYRIQNVVVVDADTIRADVLLDFKLVLKDEKIRLLGFDSWETVARRGKQKISEEERAKGRAATQFLQSLLDKGQPSVSTSRDVSSRDSFGRLLLFLTIETDADIISVADRMIDGGHDRDTRPDGTKRKDPL